MEDCQPFQGLFKQVWNNVQGIVGCAEDLTGLGHLDLGLMDRAGGKVLSRERKLLFN